jgi:hypothetical protein
MSKPWLDATTAEMARIPPVTGVYEVRDADGVVLDIGYAGSREPFGLKSRIGAVVAGEGRGGLQFRYESQVVYMSRYVELVLAHRAFHGGADPYRVAQRPIPVIGRLSLHVPGSPGTDRPVEE